MNHKHLLWWVFRHLEDKHPEVLTELLDLEGEFGEPATFTVAEAMQERYEAYKASTDQ